MLIPAEAIAVLISATKPLIPVTAVALMTAVVPASMILRSVAAATALATVTATPDGNVMSDELTAATIADASPVKLVTLLASIVPLVKLST